MCSSPTSNLSLTDTVDISGNDDIQSIHPSRFENVGKEVFIQPLDLCQYKYEVFIRIDQVKIFNFHFHDVRERHCKELSDSLCKQGYDYKLGLMTVFNSRMSTERVPNPNV